MDDPFSYSARWDSVGLDCAYCVHEAEVSWPNTAKDYHCTLHGVSLSATLQDSGYKEGEWFCSSFKNDGGANAAAMSEFESVQAKLSPNTLYGAYGREGKLKEIPFVQL